jgi:integrase
VLKGVPLMPVNNLRDSYMTPEETSRLVHVLTADDNTSVCAILLFLLNTGARKMEAIKAKWADVDLENRPVACAGREQQEQAS